VVGLGRSGVAAGRLLRRRGVPVYASDQGAGPALEAAAAELRGLGAVVETGGHDLVRIARAGLVVVSPGVPPDAPPLAAARRAGVEVRAELDLALEALAPRPYVGVTGTNGKSTTTALVAHLLAAAGHPAEAVGNIGTPASDLALRDPAPDWLAIEFSSFQLHDCPRVAPRAGILTNLSPDHLDRYPSLADYYADKRLFFRNATPDSWWIGNADDADSGPMLEGIPGRHLRFSVRGEADGWLDRASPGGVLRLGREVLLPAAELPLLGEHNVANALAAALAVSAAAPVDAATLAEGLRTFRPLAHRLEPVREAGGILWINDSKATNLGSTEVALAAMTRPYVVLLGGRHKGERYGRLVPWLRRGCRAVIAYGEAAPLIVEDLGDTLRTLLAGSFEEAVLLARREAQSGDAVLLSPACSSYDMFDNYEQRGALFRALVEAM